MSSAVSNEPLAEVRKRLGGGYSPEIQGCNHGYSSMKTHIFVDASLQEVVVQVQCGHLQSAAQHAALQQLQVQSTSHLEIDTSAPVGGTWPH